MNNRKNRLIPENAKSLTDALNDKVLKIGFRLFLESEFSVENLDFWLEAEKYKKIKNLEQRKQRMCDIYREFVCEGAQHQVNITHFIRQKIALEVISEGSPLIEVFTGAQKYIFSIMENDSYARFVRSKYYEIFTNMNKKLPRLFLKKLRCIERFFSIKGAKSKSAKDGRLCTEDGNNNCT